jgi:hypothetical protein
VISAVDLQNASETVVAESLNNLNSMQNVLKEHLPLNFMPTVFKRNKSRETLKDIII